MKRTKKTYYFLIPVLMGILLYGCVEPFDATFEDFESALVVEATITNEMKQQTVYLTRTYEFKDGAPIPESNASVQVEDQMGNSFAFQETGNGVYMSTQPFSAQSGNSYRLFITTQNGRSYSSEEVSMKNPTQIDELRAERITNDDGEDGIALLVDSYDSTNSSQYYRYTFEETFKIIAPNWSPNSLRPFVDPDAPACAVEVVEQTRDRAESICYATRSSNAIIITETSGFDEDRVDDFMVRFVNRDDYTISHRYSIKVKQYVQSNAAYSFYETLKQFSGDESLFSETQPGFILGNVSSDENENEKVLGYFDASPVTEQRIFLNYEDFYPGEDLPPYIDPCEIVAPPLARGVPPVCVLRNLVEGDLVRYVDTNDGAGETEGPYLVVPRVCGDCTEIGSSTAPEFWVE